MQKNTDIENDIEKDEEYVEEYAGDQIKKLQDELKACKAERQEYLEGWQRAKADFVNVKRENDEHKKEYVKYAEEDLVQELFPVIDSFEMAFANKEAWEKVDKNWRMGVEYIHSQLMSVFEKRGLKEMNPIGEMFDPQMHISVESVVTTNKDDNHKILGVMQKGYTLHGKVIRPARVKVAVLKDEKTDDAEEGGENNR